MARDRLWQQLLWKYRHVGQLATIASGNYPGLFTPSLLSRMSTELIVDWVLGAGQSHQLAGEFSVNLDLGDIIEQGKIRVSLRIQWSLAVCLTPLTA
ncbi:MAG: hypothetical protein ACFB4I_10295 [Cyanophyceae cyanobacterium]